MRRDVSEARVLTAIEDLQLALKRIPSRSICQLAWYYVHNLSAYDAFYVALAKYLPMSSLTLDKRLINSPTLDIEILTYRSMPMNRESSPRGVNFMIHLKAPNLYPSFNIVRLSHIELTVKDLTASKRFYVDTLGLILTEETEQSLYLRCLEERNHHSFVLTQAEDAGTVKRLGFGSLVKLILTRLMSFLIARACL
ncbi:MAG: VOC family protein [Deinococcales bacterium]